jgi:hypothetical protein
VVATQLDQIVDYFHVAGASADVVRPIDAPLNRERPFLGVLSAEERLIDIFSFPPQVDSPEPGIEFC